MTLGVVASFAWAGLEAAGMCALLSLMEVSFSFDNAVVNAVVLKQMDKKWQERFLTWGMVVAVFGMRFLFPVVVVAFASGLSVYEVVQLALHDPNEYGHHLLAANLKISAFGGMFLLMVFLKFIFDETKELHWCHAIESRLVKLGKLDSIEVLIAICVLMAMQSVLPESQRLEASLSGLVGLIMYIAVSSFAELISREDSGKNQMAKAVYSGLSGFIYLQVLDASFSLDGVIGAFAISKDIVVIMLGLGAGAMFVRSLTVHMVRKGTLDTYQFLEHGAHYGIGVLAIIMLISMIHPVPEIITGLVGAVFIGMALISSIRHNSNPPQR